MSAVLLCARSGLAAMFALAGAAKLASPGDTARAASQFGLPRLAGRPVAVALPIVELATAFALLGRTSALGGAVAAAVLLGSFLAVTGQAVARGRAVACHCFGSLSTAPVGRRTVVRNAALLAAAAATAGLTARERSPLGLDYQGLDTTGWAVLGLAVVVVLMAVAFWRVVVLLLEQQGRLLLRLDELAGAPNPAHGLPVGAAAPPFSLPGVHGETLTLTSLTALGRPVLVVFSDPQCGPCAELIPTVAQWQRERATELSTVVVAAGSREDNLVRVRDHRLTTVLLDADRTVSAAYRSPGTPSAVLIGPDGRILAEMAVGAPAVRTLAASVVADGPTQQPAAAVPTADSTAVGRPAPAFALPDLEGQQVTAEWFGRHESTVVLFWNPACGFCQRMEARLQHWDHQAAHGDHRLLVISTGDAQANAGLRLHAPVLLDDGSVMRAFGATGTPMAVVVDPHGIVVSEIAAGEQAVFDLLGPAFTTGSELLPLVPGGRS